MRIATVLVAVVLCVSSTGIAQEEALRSTSHFETHIRPVLASTCVKCHGPEKQEAELRLDSIDAMLQGGESGPAIVPGKPDESLLVTALHYDDVEMPPSGPLAAEKIRQFELWVQRGAKWPKLNAEIRPAEIDITAEDRQWWAFQPLQRIAPPEIPSDEFSRNGIDRFIYAALAERGMQPALPANRETIVRRLYLNVIGLPPTPELIDAYVHDHEEDAYERLVDSLLADQRYGEHWARFWLDLVRYAESDGWKADAYRPHIWRYRDYVVRAFNQDKPYPDFVREQLAGDELAEPTPESLAATGYLRLGIYEYNQRNARRHWDDILNELTDVTGDVFLGIGMACARCHDHKFDPLLQVDYFKLRAFFEPIVFRDDSRYATPDEIAAYEASYRDWQAQTSDIQQQLDSLLEPYNQRKLKATVAKFPLEIQASFHKPEHERNSWDQQMAYLVQRQFYEEGNSPLKSMKREDKAEYETLESQLAKFDKPRELPALMSATNFNGELAETTLPSDPERPIRPGFIRVLSESCGPEFPDCGQYRRSALADWICDPSNPLTTRVIVNRIWKQHFGQGIVSSVSDFGSLGGQPAHPELLDWLTATFIEQGWRFKELHKLILMSATWRQSATNPRAAEYAELDPQNRLLWRRDVQRLTAEQIRDAMLLVSGELAGDIGGPSVTGNQPRRSLYVKSFRNTPDHFLYAFDVANGLKSIGQRNTTTTPMQALMLINGEYALHRARNMAKSLGELTNNEDRVVYAVRSAWGRYPTAQELQTSIQFVASDSTGQAFDRLTDFCHVLLNSNEFLYVD